MKKTLLTLVKTTVFLLFIFSFTLVKAQTLKWQRGTATNWFYDASNWITPSGGEVPAGTLESSCFIGNDLLIENSDDLMEMPGVRRNISLDGKEFKMTNSSLLMQIPEGSGFDLGGGNLVLDNSKLFSTYVNNANIELKGESSLFLFATDETLENSSIDIQSEDSWVYLVNVFINDFSDDILSKITLNGTPANSGNGGNVRVFAYNQGVAIAPVVQNVLVLYDNPNLTGQSLAINSKWNPNLGALNNRTSSFKLKKGYMAVMMDTQEGESLGETYIAIDEDLVVNLEGAHNNKYSFIRMVPWKYSSKKGACFVNNLDLVRSLDATWFYEWEIRGWSQPDLEFVHLMRGNREYEWNTSHPNWNDINWQGNPHFLYLNEPDAANQGNVPVQDAIAGYPNYLEFGLRTGSPAYTDNARGWSELDEFVEGVEANNQRLDFIAVHYYQKGSPTQLLNRMKQVYEKHKRPIWITELNHGCTWTGNKTLQQGRDGVAAFLEVLDTLPYIERYAVFSCGGTDEGNPYSLFSSLNPIELNITGDLYKNHIAPSSQGFTAPYYNVLRQATLANATGTCNVITSTGDLIEKNIIQVLPNPFKDYISIRSSGTSTYRILNTTGKVILAGTFDNQTHLNTANLSKGTFVLEVIDAHQSRQVKIQK